MTTAAFTHTDSWKKINISCYIEQFADTIFS